MWRTVRWQVTSLSRRWLLPTTSHYNLRLEWGICPHSFNLCIRPFWKMTDFMIMITVVWSCVSEEAVSFAVRLSNSWSSLCKSIGMKMSFICPHLWWNKPFKWIALCQNSVGFLSECKALIWAFNIWWVNTDLFALATTFCEICYLCMGSGRWNRAIKSEVFNTSISMS